MIKLLPISNCYECKYRFGIDEYDSLCSLLEEPNEKKRVDSSTSKFLSSSEGIGIPKWCPLKTKRGKNK